MCGHIHETTTQYDAAEKLLTFLLFCPECGTKKVIETLHYEPEFRPGSSLRASGVAA